MEIKQLRRGTDYKLSFSIQNPDGSVKNLTGTLSLKLLIKKYFWDTPTAVLEDELTIISPTEGTVEIELSDEFIGTLEDRIYYLELRHTNALSQNLSIPMYAISII